MDGLQPEAFELLSVSTLILYMAILAFFLQPRLGDLFNQPQAQKRHAIGRRNPITSLIASITFLLPLRYFEVLSRLCNKEVAPSSK